MCGEQLSCCRRDVSHGTERPAEVLGEFVQTQKSGVGRFIADQVKSWDIDVLIGRVELTVGRETTSVRQIIEDPDGDQGWALGATIDLDESNALGEIVFDEITIIAG